MRAAKRGLATNSRLWNWLAVPGLPHGIRSRVRRVPKTAKHPSPAAPASHLTPGLQPRPQRRGPNHQLGLQQHRLVPSGRAAFEQPERHARGAFPVFQVGCGVDLQVDADSVAPLWWQQTQPMEL